MLCLEVGSAVHILGVKQQRLCLDWFMSDMCTALSQEIVFPGSLVYAECGILSGQICVGESL